MTVRLAFDQLHDRLSIAPFRTARVSKSALACSRIPLRRFTLILVHPTRELPTRLGSELRCKESLSGHSAGSVFNSLRASWR